MKKNKYLIINILISVIILIVNMVLTYQYIDFYQKINLPKIVLPIILLPIIWLILSVLITISSYLIYCHQSKYRESALILYYFILLLNFIWPITFFNYQNFLLSLAILLSIFISLMILGYLYYQIKHTSAYLLIPYFIWIIYNLYFNFWIFINN